MSSHKFACRHLQCRCCLFVDAYFARSAAPGGVAGSLSVSALVRCPDADVRSLKMSTAIQQTRHVLSDTCYLCPALDFRRHGRRSMNKLISSFLFLFFLFRLRLNDQLRCVYQIGPSTEQIVLSGRSIESHFFQFRSLCEPNTPISRWLSSYFNVDSDTGRPSDR